MSTFLKLKGFEVVEASTCESARAVLNNGGADVVITDLNLPDGKGDELLPLTDAPVIVMTGQVEEATRQRIEAEGFAAFLPKPATLDQVLTAVEQSLSK
jgi:two-component system, cell cycle sensor histidine kinase and response regulator CckA